MAKPLSPDLRIRIIRAVEEGHELSGRCRPVRRGAVNSDRTGDDWWSTGACEARVQGGTGARLGSSAMLRRSSPWSRQRLT